MAKRKHAQLGSDHVPAQPQSGEKVLKTNGHVDVKTYKPVIQIVTGSYEKALHGFTATLEQDSEKQSVTVQFSDSFLFNAHASAVRSLALSPLPDSRESDMQGVYLATGGSDEKINLYSLAASPVVESNRLPAMPSFGDGKIQEDPRNRELGSLMHHSSSVTALYFPTRSKLLSASEDNTIVVSKTKNLSVVSTIKVPRPKVQGQASGDTTAYGAIASGVNDFAVHPSLKLMLSVGRGERCMRLWNLVTGKKGGVLNFDKALLQSIKEGKYSSGEGRRIRWHPDGNEYGVAFERGILVFDADSQVRSRILPQPLTKVHQIAYTILSTDEEGKMTLLSVSTEDGRILFYSTARSQPPLEGTPFLVEEALHVAQLGGKVEGVNGRIKDFQIVHLPAPDNDLVVITAGSDGVVRLWLVPASSLLSALKKKPADTPEQVGRVLGTSETGRRITCLAGYLMQDPVEDVGLSEFEGWTEDEGDDENGTELG